MNENYKLLMRKFLLSESDRKVMGLTQISSRRRMKFLVSLNNLKTSAWRVKYNCFMITFQKPYLSNIMFILPLH